jgi:hypothetical protein
MLRQSPGRQADRRKVLYYQGKLVKFPIGRFVAKRRSPVINSHVEFYINYLTKECSSTLLIGLEEAKPLLRCPSVLSADGLLLLSL